MLGQQIQVSIQCKPIDIVYAEAMPIALNLGYRCLELDVWSLSTSPSLTRQVERAEGLLVWRSLGCGTSVKFNPSHQNGPAASANPCPTLQVTKSVLNAAAVASETARTSAASAAAAAAQAVDAISEGALRPVWPPTLSSAPTPAPASAPASAQVSAPASARSPDRRGGTCSIRRDSATEATLQIVRHGPTGVLSNYVLLEEMLQERAPSSYVASTSGPLMSVHRS